MQIKAVEIILFVKDKPRSRNFYSELLDIAPITDVTGMTEFPLGSILLGLMPEDGISGILDDKAPHPRNGAGIPRCELYLSCEDVLQSYAKALSLGAKSVSPPADRDWGDHVAYVADPDGHLIAFAKKI